MLRGIIRGNIVSTRKQESLVGAKFMEVEIMDNGELTPTLKIRRKIILERLAPQIALMYGQGQGSPTDK